MGRSSKRSIMRRAACIHCPSTWRVSSPRPRTEHYQPTRPQSHQNKADKMKTMQRLGLVFSRRHPSTFASLHSQFKDPSVRSQKLLSELRQIDSSVASAIGGAGMMPRLFWFLNPNLQQPVCKTCRDSPVNLDKVTRTFCTYCSPTCRNLDPDFRSKAFDRFGGHPMRDPEIRAKVAKTWSKNFEGGHPSRDPVARLRMHGFRRKPVKDLYDGLHKAQGYEDQVIADLICSHLTTDPTEIPVIHYRYGGQRRSYFPDILAFMPIGDGSLCAAGNYEERLIEVKSVWTFVKDFQQNVAKFEAATAYCNSISDASFWLVVVLKNGRKIWCRNPDRAKLQRLKERFV